MQLKAKLTNQTEKNDDNEFVATDDGQEQTTTCTTPENPVDPVVLEVKPKRSSSRASVEEERLLSALDERGRQSMKIQEKLLDMVKPAGPPSERSTFGEWTKAVMVDLDQSLWRQFQQEQSQLLYKYLDLNDRAKSKLQQGCQSSQPQQQQWQNPQPRQQWQQNQHMTSSNSQSSQWQPPPQNWPTTVATTSVWNSMNSSWVQSQMSKESNLTTLQPRRVTQKTASSAIGSITESPRNEDTSLSGIFSDPFV